MTTIFIPGPPQIAVSVKKSARAKRLSLRVSSLDGRVTLSAPNRVSPRKIEAFVFEKEAWLRQNITRVPAPIKVQIGSEIPVLGRRVFLAKSSTSRIWHQEVSFLFRKTDLILLPVFLGTLKLWREII